MAAGVQQPEPVPHVPQWTAQRVLIDHSVVDEMVMVELAEQAYDPGRTIVLQTRLSEPSAQDRELGMDSYCLSDELGRSVYDCVLSCEVANGMVHLELSEVAVRLGFDRELTVALELDPRLAGLLQSALTLVLGTFGPAGAPKLVFAP